MPTLEEIFGAPPTQAAAAKPSLESIFAAPEAPVPEEEPGFVETLKGAVPEIVGGTVAGLATAARRTPIGAAAVGLGAGAGEAFKQIGEQVEAATGLDVPLVRGEEAPATSLEAARRIAGAGVRGAAGEAVARGVLAGAGALGRKLQPTLRAGAREAIEATQAAMPKTKEFFRPLSTALGIKKPALLPAEATESTLIDSLQGIAEASFFGSGKILKSKETTDSVVSGLIDDLSTKLTGGAGRVEVGELLQDAVGEGIDAFNVTASGLYKQVDNLLGGANVNISGLKETAEELFAKAGKGLPGGQAKRMLRTIASKADDVTFEEAQILRSDLLNVGRQGTDLVPGRVIGFAKRLSKEADAAMETSAKELSAEGATAWRNANDFWKTGKSTFNSSFVKRLANLEPEVALDKALQTGKATTINKLRDIIMDPKIQAEVGGEEIWSKVQGQFVKKVMKNAFSDEITGELSGKHLLSTLRKQFDPDVMKAIAPKGELKQFENFARALALNQAKQPGKALDVAVRLGQAGAIGSLIFSDFKGESAAILLAPFVMSRAMTNPAIVKVLTSGMKAPASAKELTKFMSRLTTQMDREGMDYQTDWDQNMTVAAEAAQRR
jgi:hypothetical protein